MTANSAYVDSHQEQFRRAIEDAGLTPPPFLKPGGIVRFPGVGKSNGNKAGWAWVADDEQAGAFGDWSTGLSETWHAERATPMTLAERDAQHRRVAEAQRIREAEQTKAHTEAAERARQIWEAAPPAPSDHPYLQRKGVGAYGLRLGSDGRLIAPIYKDGALSSLEYIEANGDKEFLWGGAKKGGSFAIGDPHKAQTLLLAEGYATGASLHEATNLPVVIAFDAGNLEPVAKLWRAKYPDAKILLCGDNDASGVGQAKAGEAAQAVNGLVAIPNLQGDDWNDVRVRDGLEAVKREIEITMKAERHEAPQSAGHFAPIPASQLLDEPEVTSNTYIWKDFIAEGALAGLVAKPKVGKSTIAYELAVKVAQGLPFLGYPTQQCPVLILAVEEHRREIKRRLRDLGADRLDNLHAHVGRLDDSPTTFHRLAEYIAQHSIKLVLLDTLNSFWSIQDENDAVSVTRAFKPLLSLARESGAAILLLHHARKSEGEFGDEIRGSGALFSLLDVALVLKRHEVENQRKLTAISRYPDTPAELILELRDHGYECLGDPSAVGKAAKLAKLTAALSEEPAEVRALALKAGVPTRSAYSLLEHLHAEGKADRTGEGRRKSPYLYASVSFRAYRGGGSHETKLERERADRNLAPSVADSFHAAPHSKGLPRNEMSTVSFPVTPVPPARNETMFAEESEVINLAD